MIQNKDKLYINLMSHLKFYNYLNYVFQNKIMFMKFNIFFYILTHI